MTKKDALIYFPVEDVEELNDAYSDYLFEFQQFFVSRVPVTRLFNSKIEKLVNIRKAYELLRGGVSERCQVQVELRPFNIDDVYGLVTRFQENQNKLRHELMMAKSITNLIIVVRQLLENMGEYAASWSDVLIEDRVDVRITHPVDEVELLMELEQLNKGARIRMEDIKNLDSTSLVYKEAIRLSLWRKLEMHV